MKTIVKIEYKKIAGKKVDKGISEDKNVRKSLDNFSQKLCDNLNKYLKESKIKAKITYELK